MMNLKCRRETSVVKKDLKMVIGIISIQRNKRLCSQRFQPGLPNPAEGRKERAGAIQATIPLLVCHVLQTQRIHWVPLKDELLHGMKAKWKRPWWPQKTWPVRGLRAPMEKCCPCGVKQGHSYVLVVILSTCWDTSTTPSFLPDVHRISKASGHMKCKLDGMRLKKHYGRKDLALWTRCVENQSFACGQGFRDVGSTSDRAETWKQRGKRWHHWRPGLELLHLQEMFLHPLRLF